jgi:hypothetical protein
MFGSISTYLGSALFMLPGDWANADEAPVIHVKNSPYEILVSFLISNQIDIGKSVPKRCPKSWKQQSFVGGDGGTVFECSNFGNDPTFSMKDPNSFLDLIWVGSTDLGSISWIKAALKNGIDVDDKDYNALCDKSLDTKFFGRTAGSRKDKDNNHEAILYIGENISPITVNVACSTFKDSSSIKDFFIKMRGN